MVLQVQDLSLFDDYPPERQVKRKRKSPDTYVDKDGRVRYASTNNYVGRKPKLELVKKPDILEGADEEQIDVEQRQKVLAENSFLRTRWQEAFERDWWNVKDACRLLGISEATMYRYLKSGIIEALEGKNGSQKYVILSSELEKIRVYKETLNTEELLQRAIMLQYAKNMRTKLAKN